MKKYLFRIYLTGIGKNVDEAWIDAVEATDLSSDPTPDKDDWEELYYDEDES